MSQSDGWLNSGNVRFVAKLNNVWKVRGKEGKEGKGVHGPRLSRALAYSPICTIKGLPPPQFNHPSNPQFPQKDQLGLESLQFVSIPLSRVTKIILCLISIHTCCEDWNSSVVARARVIFASFRVSNFNIMFPHSDKRRHLGFCTSSWGQ
jgi:hypothetical protein